MSRWLFVALVVLSTAPSVVAQTVEQDVMKAEQARAEARRKGDAVALGRVTADDLLLIGPSGQELDKKAALALAAAPKLDVRDVKTQMFGDVAVVTGIQPGTGTDAQDARFTRVWRKRNGQWVNVFGQLTPITPPAPTATPPSATSQVAPTTNQAAPTSWPKGASQDERDAIETQRRITGAFARKDSAAYTGLTADNYIRINAGGSVSSRDEFLKQVIGTPEQKRTEPNNSKFLFRTYGPILMLSSVSLDGSPQGTRITRLLVKENGTWKQLVSQSTVVRPQ